MKTPFLLMPLNPKRRPVRPGWPALLVCGVAALLAGCQSAVAVPPGGGIAVPVPGGIARLAVGTCALPGQAVVTTHAGRHFKVTKQNGSIALEPLSVCPPAGEGAMAGMMADGTVTRGRLTVRKAWLAGPTGRYGHGILGDEVEATQLRMITEDDKQHTFTLDSDSVFEDLFPRVVDLEGDGQEEVLLVRSRLNAGAATALFGVVGGQLRLVAESEPIGRPNRWLNPVGVADFDGDGRREIAVVITPHIGGILTLYEKRGARLVKKYSRNGFSNHFIGSRELGMSAVLDLNGDGVPDMAVPGPSRRSLRIVTFAGGTFRVLRRHRYGRKIVTAIVKANFDTQIYPDLIFGLDDGTLVVLPR